MRGVRRSSTLLSPLTLFPTLFTLTSSHPPLTLYHPLSPFHPPFILSPPLTPLSAGSQAVIDAALSEGRLPTISQRHAFSSPPSSSSPSSGHGYSYNTGTGGGGIGGIGGGGGGGAGIGGDISANDGTMMVATGVAIETLLEQMWGFRKDKEGKRVKGLCDLVMQGCVDDLVSSVQPSSVPPSSVQPLSLRTAIINGTATLSAQVNSHNTSLSTLCVNLFIYSTTSHHTLTTLSHHHIPTSPSPHPHILSHTPPFPTVVTSQQREGLAVMKEGCVRPLLITGNALSAFDLSTQYLYFRGVLEALDLVAGDSHTANTIHPVVIILL